MNGVALVVALATLGVDYSTRTTEDGQLEYTIQIEQEFLKPLAEGEEIHSDVPSEVGNPERLCIRIGTTSVRHTASTIQRFKSLWASAGRFASADTAVAGGDTQTTVLWPARANPEQTFGITHGWQPNAQGLQEYYIQIDPTVLKTLAAGDEVHAAIDPAAGRVEKFIVSSGSKQLPRVGAQLATSQPAVAPAPLPSAPTGRSRFTTNDSSTAPVGTTGGARAGTGNSLPSTAPPLSNGGYSRFNTETSPATADLRSPTFDSGTNPAPAFGISNNPPPSYQPSLNSATDPRGYGQQPLANPGRLDDLRGSIQPPAADYQQPLAPPPSYVQPVGAQQPQYPTQQQPPPYAPPPQYVQPQPAAPTTSYSPPNNNDRLAAVQPPPSASAIPPRVTPVEGGAPTIAGTSAASANGPTGLMWLFLMFALFLSIGGNAYLAWTAAEFYSRYRTAVDRLRSAART